MHPPTPYLLHGRTCWLTAEKCLFWEDEKILIISDLHFGKTGHFRRSGIPVPNSVYMEDLQRLFQQVQYFQPRELIFVGDLFHSRPNLEHGLFRKWRLDLQSLPMHLVMGNHDLHSKKDHEALDLIIHDESFTRGEFTFVHDLPPSTFPPPPSPYFITGHIHPGIRLNGRGRQSFRFPCFHFTSRYAVLPAFGRFTGLSMIEPKKGDDVFAIVENKLIRVDP